MLPILRIDLLRLDCLLYFRCTGSNPVTENLYFTPFHPLDAGHTDIFVRRTFARDNALYHRAFIWFAGNEGLALEHGGLGAQIEPGLLRILPVAHYATPKQYRDGIVLRYLYRRRGHKWQQ